MAADVRNDRSGEVRVGISYTCGRAVLPLVLPEFRKTHPLVELTLREDTSSEMEKLLLRGDLDLIIDFMPIGVDNTELKKLIEERLFLVAPKSLMVQGRYSSGNRLDI